MKNIIGNINIAFDHRVKLGIMSLLMVNDHPDFNFFVLHRRQYCQLHQNFSKTYIQMEKLFIDRKPNKGYNASNRPKGFSGTSECR